VLCYQQFSLQEIGRPHQESALQSISPAAADERLLSEGGGRAEEHTQHLEEAKAERPLMNELSASL